MNALGTLYDSNVSKLEGVYHNLDTFFQLHDGWVAKIAAFSATVRKFIVK